jgi:hypothetical protein
MLPLLPKIMPLTAWFSDAFPDQHNEFGLIPNNSTIDKNKTGFGITHSELMAKRNSLLHLPYVPIIEEKMKNEYPLATLFAVTKGITPKMVEDFLKTDDGKYKKLLVTPESFHKVIIAAKSFDAEWLFKNFFSYYDEPHAYAIDSFRGAKFLTPLKYVAKFKKYGNLSFGTATPYPFSNPDYNSLTKHVVRFDDTFGKISIMPHEDPKTVLHHLVKKTEMFPDKVFIMLNSVTGIGDFVNASGITDVAILCSEEEKNMINLGESVKYYTTEVARDKFKKFNFFTCRYFDGFDLQGNVNDTIILVTDRHIPHTMVGIDYRGKQSVGRVRLNPGEKLHKIIHITNILEKPCMEIPEKVLKELQIVANYDIKMYNQRYKNGIQDKFGFTPYIEQFADIEDDGLAVINDWKVDQHVYKATFMRHYNDIDSIQKCWESCNYETEIIQFSLSKINGYRKSKSEINKQVIAIFEVFTQNSATYSFGIAQREINALKDEHSILFQAYHLFGPEKLKEWDYNDKIMTEKLSELSNSNKEAKLRALVADWFETKDYDKKQVKDKLQEFYDLLELKNKEGKRKIAFPKDLEELGMFEIQKPKVKDNQGKRKEVYRILRRLFSVSQAA